MNLQSVMSLSSLLFCMTKLISCVFMNQDCNPSIINDGVIHGRYTRDIRHFEIITPIKVKPDGSFDTFQIPHSFDANLRKRRSLISEHYVHYNLTIGGVPLLVKLAPNVELVSPGMVLERRRGGPNITDIVLSRAKRHLCHYKGRVRGQPDSRVALSGCDGLVGYLKTNNGMYFVEPVNGEVPTDSGEHVHVVYKRSVSHDQNVQHCSVRGDWWNAWAEEMFRSALEAKQAERENISRHYHTEDQAQQPFPVVHRQHSRSDVGSSVPRYMEICVVADKKFLEHHKGTDIEEYILTIMNIVSDYYHDMSIGNLINVVVVRIIYLEKEKSELDLEISTNASATLDSFCNWQVNINPKDPNHPNHHDLAVLFTRYDICTEGESPCNLLGLAFVGTACNPIKNCAINEDTGLLLGVVTAHELGHNMGCAHDSPEESGCSNVAPDKSATVMSPNVAFFSNIWSTCSRQYVTQLLENKMGECLLDEPQDHNYPMEEMPAGAVYDGDEQCKMAHGPQFIAASIGGDKFCKMLWCKLPDSKSSHSKGDPPADGTKCGTNMWCFEEECVEQGERPTAVNGEWGQWGPASECSRSCGGGVTVKERQCDNPSPSNRGRYCTGRRKQYEMCNTQPCPLDSPRFREKQCSDFDTKIHFMKGEYLKWRPFPEPEADPNPCALFCISDTNMLMKLAPRVKDGTRCKAGTKDTCIAGVCTPVGCDWKLNSKAVEDVCGLCDGDGTHCNVVQNTFSETGKTGYITVVRIPKGSLNVRVEEKEPSDNMIAVAAADEKTYYLNSNYTENPNGDYMFGGIDGVYTKPEPNREELHIKGPLTEDLIIQYVFFGSDNPGLEYSYAEATSQPSYSPKYHWEFLEWGECSARCNGGTEIARASCVEERDGRVKDDFCPSSDKPEPQSRLCNQRQCKTRWKVWKWGPCSGCVFVSGQRHRQVECVMESPNFGTSDEIIIEESLCCGSPPKSVELCNSARQCPKPKSAAEQLTTAVVVTDQPKPQGASGGKVCVDDPDIHLLDQMSKAKFEEILDRYVRDCVTDAGHTPIQKVGSETTTHLPELRFLHMGEQVLDKVAASDVRLLTVHLDSCENGPMNLTEEDFEGMGDKVPKNVPEAHPTELRGPQAAEMLSRLEHGKNVPMLTINTTTGNPKP